MIVPVNASAFSLQGLSSLFEIISIVNTKGKHKVDILGILLTRFNPRTRLGSEVLEPLNGISSKMKIRQSINMEGRCEQELGPGIEGPLPFVKTWNLSGSEVVTCTGALAEIAGAIT